MSTNANTARILADVAQTLALLAAELAPADAPAKPKAGARKAAPKKADTAPAKVTAKAEMPETLKAARAHTYEARMARRSGTKLGGLTKAERSALWAANPQIHALAATPRAKAWAAIVAAHKAA